MSWVHIHVACRDDHLLITVINAIEQQVLLLPTLGTGLVVCSLGGKVSSSVFRTCAPRRLNQYYYSTVLWWP